MACAQPLDYHHPHLSTSTSLVYNQPHPLLSPTPLSSMGIPTGDDTDSQLRSFNAPSYSSGLHPALGSQGPNKFQSHRQKIVREIYDTEHSYISQLTTVISLFLKPIRVSCLLPESTIKSIFSNIEEILSVNQELFTSMRKRSLGDAFSHLGPFLKLYSTYAENYQRANGILQTSLKQDSDFSNFVTSQEARPECCGLVLCSLLLTPVQRVPRYKLLLDDLVKHTKGSHADYEKLRSASAEIAAVTLHINEYVRRHEMMTKMVSIQQSLTGPSVPTIVSPGRSFIHEGKLMKLSNSSKYKNPMERMVFLFSDILVYAKPVGIKDAQLKYECRRVLPLFQSSVKLLDVDERAPGTQKLFEISDGDISLVFYTLDPDQVTLWAEKIRNAKRMLEEANGSSDPTNPASGDSNPGRLVRIDMDTRSNGAGSPVTRTTLFSPLSAPSKHHHTRVCSSVKQQSTDQGCDSHEAQPRPVSVASAGNESTESHISGASSGDEITGSRGGGSREGLDLEESRDTDKLIELNDAPPALSSQSTLYSETNQTGRVMSKCCSIL